MTLMFRTSGPTRWGNMVATSERARTIRGKASAATSVATAATRKSASVGRRAAARAMANCAAAATIANAITPTAG